MICRLYEKFRFIPPFIGLTVYPAAQIEHLIYQILRSQLS
jgi:hypothetical protein